MSQEIGDSSTSGHR